MTGCNPAGRIDMCDSKELLVSFLYDEIDPVAKRSFQKHLATCGECRDELAELGATRAQIATWTPPDADLGFRIIREAESPKRQWFQWSPAWGFAAAAVVLLSISAAIANLHISYGSDGLIVRTGWNHATETQADVTAVDWKAKAEELDRRVLDLERAQSQPSVVRTASGSDLSEQRVREIVGQSETRQQRLVSARLADMMREYDAQRRLDLVAIGQGMTRLQTSSGADLKQTRDLLQRYLVRTALEEKEEK
jgi:Putative zinc-finger